jgi:hypothetical protein
MANMSDAIWRNLIKASLVSAQHESDQKTFIIKLYQNDLEHVINNHHLFEKSFLNECFLVACYNSRLDVIKYLVNELKIDIASMCLPKKRSEYCGNYGSNCFTLACLHNSCVDVIRYLAKELKINIKHTDNDGDNGFTLACYNNSNVDVIRYLVDELKMDTNHTNRCDNNGFTLACLGNFNLNVIRYLVDELKMDTNHTNNFDSNGFMMAQWNNLNVIHYLSDHTNIKQILGCLAHMDTYFKVMIKSYAKTVSNYTRFNELLEIGITKYSEHDMRLLLLTINPMLLNGVIIKNFGLINPFDRKFKEFVKTFDKLSSGIKLCYANSVMPESNHQLFAPAHGVAEL